MCEGKQYARVRASRRSVNHLKVVQLWIARKTREEALPRGFHKLFSYRAAEFLLEEITFIPSRTLQCIGDAQPDQKIEFGETHIRGPVEWEWDLILRCVIDVLQPIHVDGFSIHFRIGALHSWPDINRG